MAAPEAVLSSLAPATAPTAGLTALLAGDDEATADAEEDDTAPATPAPLPLSLSLSFMGLSPVALGLLLLLVLLEQGGDDDDDDGYDNDAAATADIDDGGAFAGGGDDDDDNDDSLVVGPVALGAAPAAESGRVGKSDFALPSSAPIAAVSIGLAVVSSARW